MYSLIKRDGRKEAQLCRCETENQCRSRLAALLPVLDVDETVLLVKAEHGGELRVLGTYVRPPRLGA